RWIAGGGMTPPRPMKARNLLERLRQAKMESRAAAASRLVGMMTAPRRRETANDGDQLPGQVRRVLHAPVHALPGEGRHQMRRVAREEHPAAPPMFGDARMTRIHRLALD